LKTDVEDVKAMVEGGQIPHSVLPSSGKVLFSTNRLDEWLQNREVTPVGEMNKASSKKVRHSLCEEIIDRSGSKAVHRSNYVNLYHSSQRVYAQVHLPKESRMKIYDGICLAIPEASSDTKMPSISTFDLMDIEDLKGFWGANRDWLLGNGQRFTNHKALAYHIPIGLLSDPDHPSWTEVEKLLKHALKRLEKN